MIDWTKPLREKGSKKPATFVCLINTGYMCHPIVCRVGDNVATYMDNGRRFGTDNPLDLENAPMKIVRYANVYSDGMVGLHDTRSDCDEQASPNRVACIRIEAEVEAGRFDD
jgi:hypothetical protein